MASNTRLTIRQTAARRLGGLHTGTITASVTAPVTSVTDSSRLLDSDASENEFIGNFFMFTGAALNAGTVRRVASYVPASGALTLGNSLASNTTSGDAYEMHEHLSPDEWNLCIDAALRRCNRRREATVTIVSGNEQYSLSALTDLTRENQILDVFTMAGAANQKRRRYLVKNVAWDVWEDDDALTLDLTTALNEDATNNLELYVAYLAPYAALATDAATTSCDLDWVVTGTLLHALETYTGRLEEAAKKNLKMTSAGLEKEFRRHAMAQAPKRAVTIGTRFA
jgi:hypothetical protein